MKLTTKINHGKARYCAEYVESGKRIRRFFKTEAKRSKFISGIWSEGPTISRMSSQEKAEMVNHWMALKEKGISPSKAIDASETKPDSSRAAKDAVADFIKEKEDAGLSKRYLKQLKHVMGSFSEAFAITKLSNVLPEDVLLWARGKGKYSGVTVRHRLGDARTFFAFSVRREWVAKNPFDKIEMPKVVGEELKILRPRAVAKLLRVAYNRDRKLCPWLALALFCGIRNEELVRLSWDLIDVAQRRVTVPASVAKTAHRRIVPIPENAARWIDLGGDIPVNNLKRRFDRLRKQAGLFDTWPQNAMRKCAASYALAATKNANETAENLGHSVTVLKAHYAALATKEQAHEHFSIVPPSPQECPERPTNIVYLGPSLPGSPDIGSPGSDLFRPTLSETWGRTS